MLIPYKSDMIIYASEIASCIGRNRYQSVDEVKVKVWARTDTESYERAMARNSISTVKDVLPECVNLNAAVACDAKAIPEQVEKILAQPVVPVTDRTVQAAKDATELKDVIMLCKPTVKLDEATEKKVNKAIVDVMEQKTKEAVSVAEVKKASEANHTKSAESTAAIERATVAKQMCDSRQRDAELATKRAEEIAAARRQEAERAERLRRQALIDNKKREEAMRAQRALAEKSRAEEIARREAAMRQMRLKEAAEAKAKADEMAKKKKLEFERTQAMLAEKHRRAEAEKAATEVFITAAMQTAKVKDCVNLSGEVTGAVHKKRGVVGEDRGLDMYETRTNKKVKFRNETFYKKYISRDLAVGGYLDGIVEDGSRIIEVKTRVNHMYSAHRETIQITAYMYVTGIHVCDLEQRLGDEIKIDTYTFDEQLWSSICDDLKQFAADVNAVIRSCERQDELLARTQNHL